MSIRRGLRSCVVLALLLSITATPSHADMSPPNDQSQDRSSTVVLVRDGGFHWAEAGVGAAAAIATTLLALGLVMALRPEHRENGNPRGARVSAEGASDEDN